MKTGRTSVAAAAICLAAAVAAGCNKPDPSGQFDTPSLSGNPMTGPTTEPILSEPPPPQAKPFTGWKE